MTVGVVLNLGKFGGVLLNKFVEKFSLMVGFWCFLLGFGCKALGTHIACESLSCKTGALLISHCGVAMVGFIASKC